MGLTLHTVERIIADRAITKPEGSHTIKLLREGPRHWAEKIGEEAIELGIEIIKDDHDGIVAEATDLLYNLLIALRGTGVSLSDIEHEFARRHTQMTGNPKLDRKGT